MTAAGSRNPAHAPMVHGKDVRPLKPETRVRIPLGVRTTGHKAS